MVEMNKGKFAQIWYNRVTHVFFLMMITTHADSQTTLDSIVFASSAFNDVLKRFMSVERRLSKKTKNVTCERKARITNHNMQLQETQRISVFYNAFSEYIKLRESNKAQPIIINQSVA